MFLLEFKHVAQVLPCDSAAQRDCLSVGFSAWRYVLEEKFSSVRQFVFSREI